MQINKQRFVKAATRLGFYKNATRFLSLDTSSFRRPLAVPAVTSTFNNKNQLDLF